MTGDEIDYEWVGKEPTNVQSNFYWRTPASMNPKDIDYSNTHHHQVNTNLSQGYQTYTIEWLPDKLTWSVNDQVVRTLLRSEVNGTKYPSSPSQIQFSVWDGGLAEPETQAWAGGPTDWSENRPKYEMYVDWVDIKCLDPVDPLTTPWPPTNQGFQGFVNPLSKDPNSPLAKDAIVLGTNAPIFSTLSKGGLHWGRYFIEGKHLISNDAVRETSGGNRLVSLISVTLFYAIAYYL
ncbi:hypothetical protein BGZ76_005807 [Entomortierella beljakovae]|nr:hypothetical protein BGZ76_005807 [Entomortierella beljakovae]